MTEHSKQINGMERARRRPLTSVLAVALAVLAVGVVAAPAVAGAFSAGTVPSPASVPGSTLLLTYVNASPLGFAASPCYKAGAYTDLCNVTYWVDKDPNGNCNPNGTAQFLTGLSYTSSTTFYFAGSDPTFPSSATYCGGGSTAVSVFFWFHTNLTGGAVAATVHVRAA